jgi:molecular chaperone GrpE
MDEAQNQDMPKSTEPAQADDIQATCEEYLAGWKRAQADYANLKKEMENDRREFAKYANERLLSNLLPAIDQYETALAFVPSLDGASDDLKKKLDNWLIGIKAVRSMWESAFKDIGLEKVPTDGAFDPNLHEAVADEAVEGKEPGSIVRVTQSGWRLNGKVLRPAKVITAK